MAGNVDDETDPVPDDYYTVLEHEDRDFQKYAIEHGIYFVPCDEYEGERLEKMHDVLTAVFNDQPVIPQRLAGRKLGRVLDCGYGAGNWVLDLAIHPVHDPDHIIAIDINPRLAPEVYENVELLLDDLNNHPLPLHNNHFDLVNSRLVAGGIDANKWNRYAREMLRILRPGGWCQMVEISFQAQSDGGYIHSNHALRQWSTRYQETQVELNKDPRIPGRLTELLTSAGFKDVHGGRVQLPMCGWPTDPWLKAIGELNKANVFELLSSIALYPLTAVRGMTRMDFELLVAQARVEAATPQLKPYFALHWAVGRKSRH